ncbi:MAG TPA: gamma-glutamylcyclotransferase family protein [Chitinophagaceae bacterium]|nr:gamma-glutamylcyclotransferase family protein [Chitinophagaceae bacterium]
MTNPGIYHLFVYGSLRRGFHSSAFEYISRYFDFISDATVKGKLFDMGDYPAAIPVEGPDLIKGELYRIKNEPEFPWAIGQLDDYEGVANEADEAQLYSRELADVHIDNRVEKAWIYWYKGKTEGKPVIESGDILEYIKNK